MEPSAGMFFAASVAHLWGVRHSSFSDRLVGEVLRRASSDGQP